MTSEICECHFYYCSFILISIPLLSGDGINKRNLFVLSDLTVIVILASQLYIGRDVIYGGGAGVGLRTPKDFDRPTNFFPVNFTLIKRKTVLLLKNNTLLLDWQGKLCFFANIS